MENPSDSNHFGDVDRNQLLTTAMTTAQTGALHHKILMSMDLCYHAVAAREDLINANRILTTGMVGNLPHWFRRSQRK